MKTGKSYSDQKSVTMKTSVQKQLLKGIVFLYLLLAGVGAAGAVDYIVDETDVGFSKTGNWNLVVGHNEGYPFPGNFWEAAFGGQVTAKWVPTMPAGTYEIWANWRTWAQYSKSVTYRIVHANGTTTRIVNQHQDAAFSQFGVGDKSKDNYLGTFCFDGTVNNYVELVHTPENANDLASADAVKFTSTTTVTALTDTLNISDKPLDALTQPAPSNIMFVLDDSGSMDWEFMTSESSGLFSGERYVFDNPGDNLYSSYYILAGSQRGRWQSQFSGYNRMYYNPKATYSPWPTMPNASLDTPKSHPEDINNGTSTLNLNNTYYSVSSSGVGIIVDNQERAPGDDFDHGNGFNHESGASNEYAGSSYYATVTGETGTWTPDPATINGSYNVYAWWTRAGTRDAAAQYTVNHDGGAVNFTVNQRNNYSQWNLLGGPYNFTNAGSVVVTRSGSGTSTSADAIWFVPDGTTPFVNIINAHYYTWNDVDGDGTKDANEDLWLVNITNPVAYYRVDSTVGVDDELIEAGELIATAAASVPATVRTKAVPTDAAAYTTERQAFANWYTYFRRRELTATAAVANVIDSLSGVQVGIRSINGRIIQPVLLLPDNKTTLLNRLYGMRLYANGTPLRRGLREVGRYYDQAAGSDLGTSPIATAADGGECQQNFAIVMTDGYWNGYSPSVGNADGGQGTPYADNVSETLADVAMTYYLKDLSSTLSNIVPATLEDSATHQHMVTYGVSFGVFGNYQPADIVSTFNNWPSPYSSNAAKIDDLLHASVNGRGTFLSAADPEELVSSLLAVIQNIEGRTGSAAAVAVNGDELYEKVGQNVLLYQSSYNTNGWWGDLTAYNVVPSTGKVIYDPVAWNAVTLLESFLDDPVDGGFANRIVATYNEDSSVGIPFRYASLNATQQAQLDADATKASAILDYLRGDDSNEAGQGGAYSFRSRSFRLGDIVNSMAEYRDDVLYVGGNDGMLHAFDAVTGQELFAYVPNIVFSNLKELSDTNYDHLFYVDNSPYTRVMDEIAGGGSKTYLVSGLGKGGRGYFCLDVSDVSDVTDTTATVALREDALAAKVKWEYSAGSCPNFDADMGYSFSRAVIVKSEDASINVGTDLAGYVVIFGNGYDSANGDAALYVLNPETGALLKKIIVGDGPNNGLSTTIPVDVDNDYKLDYLYAGDLKGNLWKFDMSDSDYNNWDVAYKDTDSNPAPLFRTQNTGSGRQPITVRPEVVTPSSTGPTHGYMVLFGTGKYLTAADLSDTTQQTIYGVWDYGDNADDAEYLGAFDPTHLTTPLSNQADGVTLLRQEKATTLGDVYIVAAFTTSVNDNIVTFTDTSRGTVDAWAWDFNGDGTVDATTQGPHSYTYAAQSTPYTVTLTVTRNLTDRSVSNTKTAYVTTYKPWQVTIAEDLSGPHALGDDIVLASFSAVGPTADLPTAADVVFTDHSLGTAAIATWSWDFDGDGIEDASGQGPHTYNYAAVGTYNVSLTVTDVDGVSDTKTYSSYVVVSNPWLNNVNQESGSVDIEDYLEVTKNAVHYCEVIDRNSIGTLSDPGLCVDDLTTTTVDESTYTPHAGWYYNLPESRERVIVDPMVRSGNLIMLTYVPQESRCSTGGYSWIYEINAQTGEGLVYSVFDLNDDAIIDSGDEITVETIDAVSGEVIYVKVNPSAVRIEGRGQRPTILRLGDTDILNISTSRGNIEQVTTKGEQVGMYYWREVN